MDKTIGAFSAAAVLVLLSSLACGGDNRAGESRRQEKTAVPVEVTTPVFSSMESTLNLTATVFSEDQVPVYAEAAGIVEGAPLEEGTPVSRGQVLCRLKREELELALKMAQSTLDKAQADFNRTKRLYVDLLVSADTFDQVRYALDQARIAGDQARLNLDKATVTAPISKVVAQRLVRQGDLVKPQQPLFTLVDLKSLKANLYVPEKSAALVRTGAPVRMRFASNTDMGLAYAEARDRVERVKATLPQDVREVYLQRANPNDEAVYVLGIQFEGAVDDPCHLLKNGLSQRFLRLPGVAKVDVGGADEKVVQVELLMDRIKAHRVDLYELTRRLRRDNFTLASGRVDEGGKRYLVRSIARYPSLEAIGDLPVRSDGLKASDIARVTYGVPEVTRHFRIDGSPSYVLEIFKDSASNTVAVCRRIDVEVKELVRCFPGVRFIPFDNDAHYIEESLGLLFQNGLLGCLFAGLLLLFFLRRVKVTLLITLAIPTALLITLVVMNFAGQSLNIVSMMGFMLSVGMLVDNSVVVENIHRLQREEGLEPRPAALKGASEVGLAILMSTLTTMVVFLPSVLLTRDGMMRFFMGQLAVPLCVSLAASLLGGLLFIPPLGLTGPGRSAATGENPSLSGPVLRAHAGGLGPAVPRSPKAGPEPPGPLPDPLGPPIRPHPGGALSKGPHDGGGPRERPQHLGGLHLSQHLHPGGSRRLHAQGGGQSGVGPGAVRREALPGLGLQDPRQPAGPSEGHEGKRPRGPVGGRALGQGASHPAGGYPIHQLVPKPVHGRGGHAGLPSGGRHGGPPRDVGGGGSPVQGDPRRGVGGDGPQRRERRGAPRDEPGGAGTVRRLP